MRRGTRGREKAGTVCGLDESKSKGYNGAERVRENRGISG